MYHLRLKGDHYEMGVKRESEHHPKRFLPSRHIFDENLNGWRSPNAKATTTRKGFCRPAAFLTKTQTGGVPPAQK